MPHVSADDVDEDVSTEHLRVASGAADSDILQVNQLTKVYQHLNKKIHAVKSLSVGIPAGEVERHLLIPVSLMQIEGQAIHRKCFSWALQLSILATSSPG